MTLNSSVLQDLAKSHLSSKNFYESESSDDEDDGVDKTKEEKQQQETLIFASPEDEGIPSFSHPPTNEHLSPL